METSGIGAHSGQRPKQGTRSLVQGAHLAERENRSEIPERCQFDASTFNHKRGVLSDSSQKAYQRFNNFLTVSKFH